MFMGLIALAQLTGVKIAEDPEVQFPDAPPGYEQQTLVAQLADAVFARLPARVLLRGHDRPR